MGEGNGTDKRALEDCHEAIDELKQENTELKEENLELREAAITFGDLAERLAEKLRSDAEDDTEKGNV